MKKWIRTLVILIVLASVAVAVYAYLRSRGGGEKGLTFVEATIGSITEKAVAVGQVEPRQKFAVKSKISGIVKRCYVEVGDQVRAGDPLFEIEPDPTPSELVEVRRRVESVQSVFDKASADYARSRELFSKGIVSKADLDSAKATFDQSQVALAQAKDNLDLVSKGRIMGGGTKMESVIRAPAAGTVLSRAVNVGDPVVPLTSFQPGTELAAVAEMSDLLFKGTVDEIDVGKMAVGLPARIKVGALPTDVVTGKVSRIAPQAQKKEGSTLFDVEIILDPGQKVVLRAGYSANADVVIREKKDILTLPERLVLFEDGGKKTFVEIPGATPKEPPKKVAVAVGLSDGLNVEVLSGLKKGDKVVQRPPKEIS
jgi:HlyD family secretion protein